MAQWRGLAAVDRFFAKVEPDGECLVWGGSRDARGYGRFYDGRQWFAHRWAFNYLTGAVPPELDHLCCRPACVAPWHLEGVSHRANVLRGRGRAAQFARATHCVNGHEFTPENTYVTKRQRFCRACSRVRGAAYRATENGRMKKNAAQQRRRASAP